VRKVRNLTALFAALLFGVTLLAFPQQAKADDKHKMYGYMQTWYANGDDGGSDTVASQTFLIRRARLGMKGKISDVVSYKILFEGAGNAPALLDVVAFLKLAPMAKLEIGQFKYNFDMIGRASSSALPFITRPLATANVTGKIGSAYRTIGMQLVGKTKTWGYAVGVNNGQGINQKDGQANDDGVGLGGQVWFKPMKGLKLMAGFASNTDDSTTGGESDSFMTAGLQYHSGPVVVRFEYYSRSLSKAVGDSADTVGFYLMGAYSISDTLQVLARYQTVELDTNSTDTTMGSIDLGINYYLTQDKKGRLFRGTKLTVNYMARNVEDAKSSKVFEERGGSLVAGEDTSVILLQVTVPY
jgi:hypothetical protein